MNNEQPITATRATKTESFIWLQSCVKIFLLNPLTILEPLVSHIPHRVVITAGLCPIRVNIPVVQPFQPSDGNPAGEHQGVPTGPAKKQAANGPGDVIPSHNVEPPWGNNAPYGHQRQDLSNL
jgi:hypothetical protein